MSHVSEDSSPASFDSGQSVESIIRAYPATAAVFRDFDIELCCSTGLSVDDAAYAAAVDRQALCAALGLAIETGGAIQF